MNNRLVKDSKGEYRRTYCLIDLDAIRHNLLQVRRIIGDAKLLAVIKADGYGHGASEIACAVEDIADYFAVATIDEGIRLRRKGVRRPIMILGYNSPSLYDENLAYDIEQTIYSLDTARARSRAAMKAGKRAPIHVALDTGMTRIGLPANEEGLRDLMAMKDLPGIEIKGLFTHLACADMEDKAYTYEQMDRYDHFLEMLEGKGIRIPLRHICNSAGIMDFDHHRYDMVRSGIITYGLYPSDEVMKERLDLKPALAWTAHVVHVQEPELNRGVSYGATYLVDKPMKIATISIGYADGYPRLLSGKGWVLIHGRKAPILGRVCMDQMMVDVTGIPDVKVEDPVTLIGKDGEEEIRVEDLSDLIGTINYEFVCDISPRVPRLYKAAESITEVYPADVPD